MKRGISQRLISALLGIALIFALPSGIVNAVNTGTPVNAEITPAMREAYNGVKRSLGLPGMRGFEGDNALPDGDGLVGIIVLFKHQPAATQQVEAAVEYSRALPFNEAENLVETDHESFKEDLEKLFSVSPFSRNAAPYEITAEYRNAVNGVAMKIPADKVEEISGFSSVYAVYPDETIQLEPIEKGKGETLLLGNQSGNAKGRSEMNVDELHDRGITGDGVTVCVIDTGVDYNHPDLADAFGNVSPSGNSEELINGKFYGRNFVNEEFTERSNFDPMETTYDEWQESGQPEYDVNNYEFYTYHGTHVSGTVVSQGVNNANDPNATSSLGVAPDATLYVYRVFGAYNRSTESSVLSAIEYVATDKPDIVNMSLGNNLNSPYYLTSLAVNNIMIANEGILFVISAGNSGSSMFTTGAPVSSSASIGIANATATTERTVITASMLIDGFFPYESNNSLGMFYMNEGGGLSYNASTENWSLQYAYAESDSDGKYEVLVMPNISGVEDIYSDVGVGTEEEFAALAAENDIQGKIILVRRGAAFLDTMAFAKQYNAGAVILINRDGGLGPTDGLDEFRGYGTDYLPFFVILDYYAGTSFYYDLQSVGYKFEFSNVEDITDLPALHYSSSRGPVLVTYDIKPDVASHGVNVLSTAPRMGEEDYSDAYLQASGTSMAAPNVSGAAALLMSAHPEWTAEEIKIRLMNTAKQLQPVSDDFGNITYFGVYEQGAGFVDAKAALDADTVVSAEYNNVITSDEYYGNIDETGVRDTGSLNFGSVNVNSEDVIEIPLDIKIMNKSGQEKNYTLSYMFNEGGQLVNNALLAGVSLTLDSESVTVGAGSTESVSVTFNAPALMGANNVGSYEGYVTVNDGANEYNLPFAAYARIAEPPLRTGNFFLNRPVISASEDSRQNTHSGNMDFFVNITKGVLLNFYVVDPSAEIEKSDDGTVDVYEIIDKKALIGELTYVDLSYTSPGEWVFTNNIVYNGEYYAYAEIDDEGYPLPEYGYFITKFPEGKATILIEALTSEMEAFYYTVDFYVDNTAPVVSVDGMDDRGDYNSVSAVFDNDFATITGNVYDSAIDAMKELDLEFSIWEESDSLPRIPDQRYNAVYALVDGLYYAADVDGATGDFSLTVPAASDFFELDLYVIDGFSVRQFSWESLTTFEIDPEFNPTVPSLGKLHADTGLDYGYIGSNMTVLSLKAETNEAHMRIDNEPDYFYPNDEKNFAVMFNGMAKANGDSLLSAVLDDENIAEISITENNVTVKALIEGETVLTLTSVKGLTVSVPIIVKPNIADGVIIETGSKVYYGSMNHMTEAINNYGPWQNIESVTKTFEEDATPILWSVMGREQISDNEFGNLTLFSEYIIDSIKFSDYGSIYTSKNDFETIRHYLNGGTYNGYDWDTWETIEVEVESTFAKNFTEAELAVIPFLRNDVPLFYLDEIIEDLSFVADGDRFYIPWLTPNTFSDSGEMDLISVYWSAGAGLYESNALVYRESNLNGNLTDDPRLITTLKGGQPYGYWTETLVADWRVYTVGGEGDPLGTVYDIGIPSYDYCGVRPAMTLDTEKIVYAEKGADDIYSLTILGENDGESVGTLNGITADAKTAILGNDLILSGVSSSAEGNEYKVSYKIVNNEHELLLYEQVPASETAGDLVINTSDLETGSYKVYLWLEKDNGINSNEAGVVSVFNMEVTAITYTVVFKDWDGTVLSEQTVEAGENAEAPVNPERSGYDFIGWSTDFTNVASNLTVTAMYSSKTDSVPLKLFDKAGNYDLEGEKFNGNYIITANGATIENFELTGNVYIQAKGVTVKNATIHGDIIIEKEVANDNAYINKVNANTIIVRGGGQNSVYLTSSVFKKLVIEKEMNQDSEPPRVVTEDTVIEGTTVSSPAILENKSNTPDSFGIVDLSKNLPANSEVKFMGEFEKVNIFASDVTLTLENNGNNQSIIGSLNVKEEAKNITVGGGGLIREAVINGAALESVNLSGVSVENQKTVYTVKFEANGGTETAEVDVMVGEKLSAPANPEKDGYDFAGWYKESSVRWDFANDIVDGNMILYAMWNLKETEETNTPTYLTPQATDEEETEASDSDNEETEASESDVNTTESEESEEIKEASIEDIINESTETDGTNNDESFTNLASGTDNSSASNNSDEPEGNVSDNPKTGVATPVTVVIVSGLTALILRKKKK